MTSDISQMIIAIPSDGALYESTLKFLDVCGLRVNREIVVDIQRLSLLWEESLFCSNVGLI